MLMRCIHSEWTVISRTGFLIPDVQAKECSHLTAWPKRTIFLDKSHSSSAGTVASMPSKFSQTAHPQMRLLSPHPVLHPIIIRIVILRTGLILSLNSANHYVAYTLPTSTMNDSVGKDCDLKHLDSRLQPRNV